MDKHLYRTFHALGDPTRLAVIEQLLSGPASVSKLAQPHVMALPAFTKHLRVLEDAKLISSEKKGRVRTCFIEETTMRELASWFVARQSMWEARLSNLAAHVENQGD